MGKIAQRQLSRAGKAFLMDMQSFCFVNSCMTNTQSYRWLFSLMNKFLILENTCDPFLCMCVCLFCLVELTRTARFCLLKKQHSGNFTADFTINLFKYDSNTFLAWLPLFSLNHSFTILHISKLRIIRVTRTQLSLGHIQFIQPFTRYFNF